MKIRVKENFGEQREFEISAMNWEIAYSKAMNLFGESNRNKIIDEYYYKFIIMNE